MSKMDEAINKIRKLECPTGDLEARVTGILQGYGITDSSNLRIDREKGLDTDEAQAYRFSLEGDGQSVVVLATSGYDDYVAKVVDAYQKS